MTSKNTTDRLEEIDELATKLALSKDPAMRCYGRLILSGVAGRFDDFLQKEQSAGTNLLDLLAAVTKYSAEMLLPIIQSAQPEHRKDARGLTLKILDAYLTSSRYQGEGNAKH